MGAKSGGGWGGGVAQHLAGVNLAELGLGQFGATLVLPFPAEKL